METLFLSLILIFSSPSEELVLKKAIEHSRNGDYEASEKMLSNYKSRDYVYIFYKMINSFKLNKKEDAIKYADLLIYDFQEIPIRYRDLAIIMKADMETWKDDHDDLDDISREMKKIADRLKNRKGGNETQKLQKNVLDRIGKMIKEEEDKKNAVASQQDKDKEKQEKQEVEVNPAPDTVNGNEGGTGRVNVKKIKEIAEVWGKLPDKERAKALVELTRAMPAKDRAVIKAYFLELQKRSGK